MLGVATLVRLCLMPNHDERPSLDDIVERTQHPALFNSFKCDTTDEVLVGIESDFWAWSPTIYNKLMVALQSGTVSSDGLRAHPDKQTLAQRLISQCRVCSDQPAVSELPLQTFLMVLRALALDDPELKLVQNVSPAAVRSFFTNMVLTDDNTSVVTLRMLEICAVLIEAAPNSADSMDERWLELFTYAIEKLVDEEPDETLTDAGRAERRRCFVYMMHTASMHSTLKTRLTSSESALMELIDAVGTAELSDLASQALLEISHNDFVRVVLLREIPELLTLVKSTEDEIQFRVVKLISSATDNPLGATQFVEAGGVVVMGPLAANKDNGVRILLEVLSILTKAAVEPALAVVVANESTVTIVIDTLTAWVSAEDPSEDIADPGLASLRLASHIVEFPSLQSGLADRGILALTATALERYGTTTKEGDQVRLSGCRCLRFLASTVTPYRCESVDRNLHLQLVEIMSTTEVHGIAGIETFIHILSTFGMLCSDPVRTLLFFDLSPLFSPISDRIKCCPGTLCRSASC
jgi:hypothetical protein